VDLARQRQAKPQSRKPGRRSARDGGTAVSALPIQNGVFDTA
jgi:hypothetical protein